MRRRKSPGWGKVIAPIAPRNKTNKNPNKNPTQNPTLKKQSPGILKFINLAKTEEKIFWKTTCNLVNICKKHKTTLKSLISMLELKKDYKGITEWYYDLVKKYSDKPKNNEPLELKNEPNRKEAENLLDQMSTLVTGVRPGENILGSRNQSKGAILKLRDAIVSPSWRALDLLRSFTDLWKIFLFKLSNITFFSNKNTLEINLWFLQHQTDNDIYLEDVENLKVDVIQLGRADFLKLSEDHKNKLKIESGINITDIFDMFPKKPGSNGLLGRHTLIFRRGIWKVFTLYEQIKNFNGPIVDLYSGKLVDYDGEVIVFSSFAQEYVKKRGFKVSKHQKIGIKLSDSFPKKYKINNDLREATKKFTPAGYKSLLQKIIRFRAENIGLDSTTSGLTSPNSKTPVPITPVPISIDSIEAAQSTFLLLLNHSGSFVPDIQRFVTGIESAFKRLIVTLLEDSFVYDENKAVSLMMGAFLAQRVPSWKPPSFLIDYSLELIEKALTYPKAYNFNIPRGIKLIPLTINKTSKPLEVVSALLEEIRSFGSDLGMVRDIVTNIYSGKIKHTELRHRPKTMPLLHCIDQHWAPEIAYFYPKSLVRGLKSGGSKPFSELFIKLFSEVTGVNPRRPLRKGRTMTPVGYTDNFEDNEFVKITRATQKLVMMSKYVSKHRLGHAPKSKSGPKRRSNKTTFEFKYNLDDGWIAGMVGAMVIRGRPMSLVSMHPNNPYKLVAVRKPSRNMKTAILTEKEENRTIKLAKELLKNGVPMNKTQAPVPGLKGCRLVLDKDMYWVEKNKKRVLWENIKKGTINFKYIEDIDYSLDKALKYEGDGVVFDLKNKIKELLTKYRTSEINRALTYISNYSGFFEVARVNKVGGGTDQAVTIDDCGAFQLILELSTLCPSAFIRVGSLKFKVLHGPLLWYVTELIFTFPSSLDSSKWGNFGEKTGRKLKKHQTEALDEMEQSHMQRKKGHFIYMTVGLGKTMLVLSYLEWLRKRNELPKYVLYTLPSSAINSIIKEIEAFGLEYTLIIPLKTLKPIYKNKNYVIHDTNPKLKKYTINLIEHDHMRRCEDSLYKYIPKAVFIMDEVHKALNNTKRTQVALQLSTLAKEFVAMTGTPIIDTNTYKLIWWLSKIVPFEVNESNFWVAANGMIAKKLNTNVEVIKNDILVDMGSDELKIYQGCVSPNLGGVNTQPKSEDTLKALEVCYAAATRGMITHIIKNLKSGVFVVAKDIKHQNLIKDLLFDCGIKDVFLIERNSSIFLTDDEVESGKQPDYRVVITTKSKAEGYTLTRLKVLITSVYPSNNAVREQLEGRINRIGQKSDKVWNITIHTGILTYILRSHNDAKNISAILNAIADEVIGF